AGAEAGGAAHDHNARSGVAHNKAADEQDCLESARELLSSLPSNNLEEPPVRPADLGPEEICELTDTDAELDTVIPDSANQPYDMHAVIERVLDNGEFCEIHAEFAKNIICGFGPVAGTPT